MACASAARNLLTGPAGQVLLPIAWHEHEGRPAAGRNAQQAGQPVSLPGPGFAAGLADSTIRNDTNHLDLIRGMAKAMIRRWAVSLQARR